MVLDGGTLVGFQWFPTEQGSDLANQLATKVVELNDEYKACYWDKATWGQY